MGLIRTKEIEYFLHSVDKDFPIPLSQKTNLREYASKIKQLATVCTEIQNGRIVSMVVGYTENLMDNIAYISVVASQKEYRGKGYAEKLIKEFLFICKEKKIQGVHLYTASANEKAIAFYKRLGFIKYTPENEPRPDDVHLIYWIKEKE